MKTFWVLLVIALVLLLWRFREGLEPTVTIKAPLENQFPPYPPEEMDRIVAMIPQTEKDEFIRVETARIQGSSPTPPQMASGAFDMQIRSLAAIAVSGFYTEKYKTATAPVGPQDIDAYLAARQDSGHQKKLQRAAILAYFVDQPAAGAATSTHQSVPTATGQSSGQAPASTGQSVLARSRPGLGDQKLRSEVAAYTALPRSDPMINTMILEMQKFYDTVYSPAKRMPTQDQIQSFVMASTITESRKPNLASVIDYWFTEPAVPGDYRLERGASSEGTTSSEGAGGDTGGSGGGQRNSGTPDGKLWGPPFRGTGTPRNYDGNGNNGDGDYPTLIGPPTRSDAYWQLKDNLPGSASLGSDFLSGFLPFSRQPGDMDRIPDPYRVSQTYSPSSYSSKNEPVPFLTDFSAFQK